MGGLVKQRVQLMALTCTLIAAKFSETKMPSLDDLCEVTHGLFTKAQLKETELETLRVLQWELHAVTPHAALEQLAVIMNHTDDQSKTFLEHAEFFIDMSYYVDEMLKFPPLVVASSALLCAWSHLGNLKAIEFHMQQLCVLCGVGQHELLPCKTILFEYFNTTYPKAAEAAEMHRAATLKAGRTSPDSVMDCHATNSPLPTKPTVEEALDVLWKKPTPQNIVSTPCNDHATCREPSVALDRMWQGVEPCLDAYCCSCELACVCVSLYSDSF